MATHKNIGSDFDSFLAEEGILGEVEASAAKRVLARRSQVLRYIYEIYFWY